MVVVATLILVALAFAQPDAQDFDGAGCERRDALLSSFPVDLNAHAALEPNVTDPHAAQL